MFADLPPSSKEDPAESVGVGQARLGGGDEHVPLVGAARPVGGRPHGHSGVGEHVGDGAGQASGVRAVVDVDGDGDRWPGACCSVISSLRFTTSQAGAITSHPVWLASFGWS